MRTIDRLLIFVLAAGIWALILQPNQLNAHSDDNHSCSGSGTGHGEHSGSEVYVYALDLEIECSHW